LTDWWRWCR